MRGPKGEDLAVNDGHRVSRSVHGAASPTSRSRIYGRAILRALPPVMSLSKPGGEETEAISPHMSEDTIIILLVLLCTLVSLLGFASVASCGRGGSAVSESESDVDDRSATRGMKKEALQALPALLYSPTSVLPRAGVDCPICLTDFVEGEKIRMLPKCGHGFHVDCIDTWLLSNSSCPICRHCLLDVCEKAPMVPVPRDSRSQALSTGEQAASTSQSASNRGPVELQRTKDDHSIKLTNLQQPRN